MDIQAAVHSVQGTAIPVPGNDIDTDQIIPARYMKVVTFDGLGEFAFRDVRWDGDGRALDHPFNEERFAGASVLIVNRNFGCGSSREHAPQALMRWGIRAIIGESFAEIFAGNCTAMGIPAITLDHETVKSIMESVAADPATAVSIDLRAKRLVVGSREFDFAMPDAYRSALIAGSWDSTSVLLAGVDDIHACAERLPYLTDFAAL